MQPPAAQEAGRRGPREPAARGAQRAGSCETYTEGAPASEPPKPGWALTLEGLEAMSPKQGHRHLLFGDLLEDVGAAASIFPRESTELGYGMPDPRAWTQALEPPAVRQDRLLGVLKAAEARGRVRALRLRYTCLRVRRGRARRCGAAARAPRRRGGGETGRAGRGLAGAPCEGRAAGAGEDPRGPPRERGGADARARSETPRAAPPQAEEISLLIQRQKSARAAIRLELFLPPQLKPTRIPDPLDRQEVPASPGRDGEGARPPPCTPGHSPSPRSGDAWRPSWRKKWKAGAPCAEGHAAATPHPSA